MKNHIFESSTDMEYISPIINILEFQSEGILCASDGNENVGETPGSDWDNIA